MSRKKSNEFYFSHSKFVKKNFTVTQMTKLDEGTQMFGKATETIFTEDRNDVILYPRKFESVEDLLASKLNKVKLIQRNARRFLLKKRVKKYAAQWRWGQ